jgi:hypothetical protein
VQPSRPFVLLLSLLAFASMVSAQPTSDVITRMTIVQSKFGSGTIFSIDVDHREYWITAKHILTGAKHSPYGTITAKSAALSLLDPNAEHVRLIPVTFSVIDVGKDIDIVVLAPPAPLLSNPLPSANVASSAVIGADCEFLGFPSATGGAWKATLPDGKSYWMPYVKHCFVSAMPSGANAMILDGVNNPGFSGGPVVTRTGPDQEIIAVVSGIVTEPAEVIPSAAPKKPPQPHHKEKVDTNSGFIVAYYLDAAVKAINKNPIGPLRPSQ